MTDEVARAYAILGLEPGASQAEIRRRYRYLARRWHPDRFATDTRNQAEAAETMSRINAAYARVAGRTAVFLRNKSETTSEPPSPARLSRDQIDQLVEAIGSEGPLDYLLGVGGWVGSAFYGLLAVLFGTACVVRLAVLLWQEDLSGALGEPELWVLLLVCGVCLAHEFLMRRRAVWASQARSARG